MSISRKCSSVLEHPFNGVLSLCHGLLSHTLERQSAAEKSKV